MKEYLSSCEEVLAEQQSSPEGLASDEAGFKTFQIWKKRA